MDLGIINKRWSYDSQGRLQALEHLEDFNGDGMTDRRQLTGYDTAGNTVLWEEDQPYDGAADWREETTYVQGSKVRHYAQNLSTGTITRDVRFVYDRLGRLVEEHYVAYGALSGRVKFNQYSPEDQIILEQWFDSGNLISELTYGYNAGGRRVSMTRDADGDGVREYTQRRLHDAADNLLLVEESHHLEDVTSTQRQLFFYGPF